MAIIQHDNVAHARTVNLAESVRQTEVDAAVKSGNSSASIAAAVKTAEIKFYRAAVASCVANGNIESGIFRSALHDLGTGGI
jgi:predicted methyltransferase MtxX (methanogen marker protein 4)